MHNTIAIAITIPASIDWNDYQRELLAAENGDYLNFKVSSFPTAVKPGDRCYIIHKGKVKGWHTISGFSEEPFECTTTGKQYSGRFIQRTGKFNRCDPEPDMKGFQGYRYIKIDELNIPD